MIEAQTLKMQYVINIWLLLKKKAIGFNVAWKEIISFQIVLKILFQLVLMRFSIYTFLLNQFGCKIHSQNLF